MAETYTIGQGVKDALAAAHDEPRSDEMYFGQDADGHSYGSVTHGRDALYRWDAVDNAVKRLPFGDADTPAPPVRMLSAIDVSSNNGMDIGPLIDRYAPDVVIIKAYQSIELGATGFRYTVAQAHTARDRGKDVAFYGWLYAGSDGGRQMESAHKSVVLAGEDGAPLYVDLETYTDGSSPNRQVCLQARDALPNYTPIPGNYTGLWWIDGHYRGGQAQYSEDWGGLWTWLSQFDGNPTLASTRLPEGYPPDKLGGKQYRGSPVDLSTFRSDALGL
jgi:hypothetical protein